MLHAIQMKYKKKDYTVIPGNWKASVTRPEHFQNPIIKSGGGGVLKIHIPNKIRA